MTRRLASIAAVAVFVLVAPVLLIGFVMMADASTLSPSEHARQDIPSDMLALYQDAADTCPGFQWTVVAAIGKLETDHARAPDQVSTAGARGPMQFMPATFERYGVDGDGDGRISITDVDDAVFSAVNYLCANGAGNQEQLWQAIWHYNHSAAYVREVLQLAASYAEFVLVEGSPDAGRLLRNPAVVLSPQARADLEAGRVDPRVVAALDAVSRRHSVAVSVFSTGHSKLTARGTISNHFYGRAADVWMIDGTVVSPMNRNARAVVLEVAALEGAMRPTEIGHPFDDIKVRGGWSDAAHDDHIHIGFDD